MLLFVLLPAAAAETQKKPLPDAFAQALTDMGLKESDLGYRPLGHWNRYPHPNTIPYVMPFFTDLFATPLDTYEFTRTLGNAVEDALTPKALLEKPDALYRLTVVLATERRIGGFRAYSANLNPHPADNEPLLHAMTTLLERAGDPLGHGVTFGKPAAEREGDPMAALRDELVKVPGTLHLPLAKYLLNLLEAREWIDRGLRRVPQELRDAVFDAVPQLSEGTPDGSRYFPAIDDVARLIDEHSLWYGCLKAVQATQDARRELRAIPAPADGWPEFEFRLASPWGTVLFDHRASGDLQVDDPFLIVRVASGGALRGVVAATARRRPVSFQTVLVLNAYTCFLFQPGP